MTVRRLTRRSRREAVAPRNGADELFSFPWPGPGNSEGPVDPDGWSESQMRLDLPAGGTAAALFTTTPWPGPGDSEG